MDYNVKKIELLKSKELGDGVSRSIIELNNDYTVTYMDAPHMDRPNLHSHPHKQFVYILEGGGEFSINDERFHLHAGEAVAIDSNAVHAFISIDSPTKWLEFFQPGREDFISEL